MADEAEALIASEYSAVRAEIAAQLAQIHTLELGVLGAIGGVWTWLFSQPNTPSAAWWVPVALVILGGLKAFSFHRSIELAGAFIESREKGLSLVNGQGEPQAKAGDEARWESYRRRKSAGLVKGGWLFWSALLLTTIAVASWRSSEFPRANMVSGSAINLKCVPDAAGTGPGLVLKCAPTIGD